MLRIQDAGPKLSDAEILGLETILGARLPQSYRRFLLNYNGGVPTPETIDVPGADDSPTDVQVFFGLGRGSESSDLRWNLRNLGGQLPKGHLPIACDSGGNLFCLVLSGEDAGKLLYREIGEHGELHLVAQDFDEFLENLRPFE